MAYSGGIDYLHLPFGGVEWAADLRSPWESSAVRTAGPWSEHAMELVGTAREFVDAVGAGDRRQRGGQAVGRDVKLVYDVTGMTTASVSKVLCVVVGKSSGVGAVEDKDHYVLLVAPKARGGGVYERVGVGRVPGRMIDFAKPGLGIKIQ
jgi:hypothetical protein